MSAKRKIAAVLIVGGFIAWIVYEFLLRDHPAFLSFQEDVSRFFLTAGLLHIVVMLLTVAVGIQGIAICLLFKGQTHVTLNSEENSLSNQTTGRGRPKKPCHLATIGIVECPFAPDAFNPSPKLIEKIVETILHESEEHQETPSEPASQKPSLVKILRSMQKKKAKKGGSK